jgi:hypothetical protein
MTNSTSGGLKPIKDLWSDNKYKYEYEYVRHLKQSDVGIRMGEIYVVDL